MKRKVLLMLFGFILGIVVSGTCVYAATLYEATEVAYDNSSSGTSNVNVQTALDELYEKTLYPDSNGTLIVASRTTSSDRGTTTMTGNTNGYDIATYWGNGGYGGYTIEGYDGSNWVTLASGKSAASGTLEIADYTEIRVSITRGWDDKDWNKTGLYIAVACGVGEIFIP